MTPPLTQPAPDTTGWILLPVLALFSELAEGFVKYGPAGLALVAFAESSFFPIPPDFIQIGLTLPFVEPGTNFRPEMAFVFAGISMAASVAGSVLGWYIGRHAGERFFTWMIRRKWLKREQFDKALDLLQRYDMGAIMIAAFTPIPYKVFTIASGVSHMPIWRLLLASAIGRGGRFFLVAALLYYQGASAMTFLKSSRFGLTTLGITAVVVIVAWLVYRMRRIPSPPVGDLLAPSEGDTPV